MTEKFIVIDTETTNSLDDPLCYDVGFAIVDKTGKVYETHSYLVTDIFQDDFLMDSAYFKEKIPQYIEEVRHGKRCLRSWRFIVRKFAIVCKVWKIKKVVAHNARFDYRALNLTQRYLTASKYRFFFPYGIKIWDTLKMSREVLKNNDDYANFCYTNEYLTKRLCKRFTAEIIYRFITNNLQFEESHTGLEDVLIEKEIFAYCLHKKPEIDGALWGD